MNEELELEGCEEVCGEIESFEITDEYLLNDLTASVSSPAK